MGIVGTSLSMSLDGFIADPQGEVGPLFNWYFNGDTEFKFPDGRTMKVSAPSANLLDELVRTTGAIVSGRKQFEVAKGWDGRHPMDVPVFVVSHYASPEWIYEGSPFTFVTDGVESAIRQAKAAAGGKNVGVDGASVAQQAIKAGLVDEVGVELMPVLLGEGIRFFDHLGSQPIEMEITRVIEGKGVTHLRYRIIK